MAKSFGVSQPAVSAAVDRGRCAEENALYAHRQEATYKRKNVPQSRSVGLIDADATNRRERQRDSGLREYAYTPVCVEGGFRGLDN